MREVEFRAPAGHTAGIEVLSVAQLRTGAAEGEFAGVQRPDFHEIILATEGSSDHMVDLVTHPLRPGTTLWVRPGQVQRWGRLHAFEGWVVLFEDAALPLELSQRLPVAGAGHVTGRCDAAGWSAQLRAVEAMAGVNEALGGAPRDLRDSSLRHALALLVTVVLGTLPPAGPDGGPEGTFHRFQAAVEDGFRTHRTVEQYARALGYSPKTLARHSIAAVGRTPSQVIHDRIALEAKRMLVHTDDPVGRIGRSLGFDDASNFVKFFALRTGVTPSAFRSNPTVA